MLDSSQALDSSQVHPKSKIILEMAKIRKDFLGQCIYA